MQLDKPDFTDLLYLIANDFKTKVSGLQLNVSHFFGKGYFWAAKLPSGITVLVSDTILKEQLVIECLEGNGEYYTLQFNEEAADETDLPVKGKRNHLEFQSFVKLSHTIVPEAFVFPPNKRLRSVKFFFNKNHLSSLLGKQAFDTVLQQYFPVEMRSENLEPIATEYRVMLDDLWTDNSRQPLRQNYIQNRVVLLLEKYIVKLHNRQDTRVKKSRRNDDEITRLMKVEALLVKNFAVNPPTIDDLARISAMSNTKLKKDFKALYGLPIYEYFQKNRMLKAKSLLVIGEYNIKEVGQMVGYSNLSHFANTFKKEFGFLPSEITAKDGVLVYSR